MVMGSVPTALTADAARFVVAEVLVIMAGWGKVRGRLYSFGLRQELDIVSCAAALAMFCLWTHQ